MVRKTGREGPAAPGGVRDDEEQEVEPIIDRQGDCQPPGQRGCPGFAEPQTDAGRDPADPKDQAGQRQVDR